MNIGQQVAQGDVFITRVESMPEGVNQIKRDNGRVVLAYGEVTGHAHAIHSENAELFVAPNRSKDDELLNVRFLQVIESLQVTHEEHVSRSNQEYTALTSSANGPMPKNRFGWRIDV